MGGLSLGLSLSLTANKGGGGVALPAQTFKWGINPGNADTDLLDDYETWFGAEIDYINLHTGRANWSDYVASIGYVAGLYNNYRRPIWSVPMFISGANLDAAAAGDYNVYWTAAAQAVLAAAPADGSKVIVRTGWEFNLTGQPWYAGNNNSKQAQYIGGYRLFVGCFRDVSDRFEFIWCPNFEVYNTTIENPELCYPGDAYVDIVSMDLYVYMGDSSSATDTWGYHKGTTYGLDWLVAFATAHGKRFGLDEWGCGKDNFQAYIALAAAYFVEKGFAYVEWWESDADYTSMLHTGNLPATGAEVKKQFGPPTITSSAAASVVDGGSLNWSLIASKPVTWQIIGGADKAAFSLTGSALTTAAKSYAAPTDRGGNNVYDVKLRAVDNRRQYVQQDFAATVEQIPVWVRTGAKVHWDFVNGRYFGAPITDLVCTRASTATAKNAANADVSFASNVPRITDLGLYHATNSETLDVLSGNLLSTLLLDGCSIFIDSQPTNTQFAYPWSFHVYKTNQADGFGVYQADQNPPKALFEIKVGDVKQAELIAATGKAVGSRRKLAARIKTNDIAASHDGAAILTDTSATLPTGLIRLRLGNNNVPNSPINGFIKELIVWDIGLSNANLVLVSAGSNPVLP